MAHDRRTQSVPRGIMAAHPISIARAEGARVWDTDGKEYLDFVGGIGVLNVGHGHPRVVAAVREQLDRFAHVCFQVASYDGYITLAERLNALVGGSRPRKTLVLSTGGEAVENAVKIARAHTRRPAIVAFQGGFHGRTLLGVTLTSTSAAYRQNFGPFAPEVHHSLFPYEVRGISTEKALESLAQLFATRVPPSSVAAFIVEPQLGEGGFVPAPPAFLRELRRLATEHGIVLILDEVQTGFGRTGRMFAFEHYGIEPDIVTLAKSVGGGLPLSAVVGYADIMDAPEPGGLGSTYAGNPLACAAAHAVLDIFEKDGLLARAAPLAEQLRSGLLDLQRRVPEIAEVRGLGAMLAIEFLEGGKPRSDMAARIVEGARERGLLLLRSGTDKNVIRFLAPLIASSDDIARALSILDAAITASRQP